MTATTRLAKMLASSPFLKTDDLRVLDSIPQLEKSFAIGQNLLHEGLVASSALLILEGLASSYHDLSDGGRQISGFLIPGDLCGIHACLGNAMDYSVEAITPMRVLVIENAVMADLLAHHPGVAMTLWWFAWQEAMHLREHLTAVGRRDARARIAYLICDLCDRYAAREPRPGSGLHLRLTQTRVADSLGLTPVHVGRVLRQFQRDRLIRIERGGLIVLRLAPLRAIAELADADLLDAMPARPIRVSPQRPRAAVAEATADAIRHVANGRAAPHVTP